MARIVAFLLFLSFVSCQNEAKPILVTQELIRRVDTTFNKQYKMMITQTMDSICEKNYSQRYDQVRDSLMIVEIGNIEKLFSQHGK